jgi:hypothetical protein
MQRVLWVLRTGHPWLRCNQSMSSPIIKT